MAAAPAPVSGARVDVAIAPEPMVAVGTTGVPCVTVIVAPEPMVAMITAPEPVAGLPSAFSRVAVGVLV